MNEKYFELAIKEAKKAFEKKEVPVGAVIVKSGKVVSKSYNMREKNNSVISHAEINAILLASKKLKTWRLNDCDIYVTLKPCAMCEQVINESRIENVYYLIDRPEEKKNYNKTLYKQKFVTDLNITNKYKGLISNFFKNMR